MHHEDGKIYEEKNKILAYIDKNYCQDKKDTPLLYYGVVLPLSLYLQVQKSEKKVKIIWTVIILKKSDIFLGVFYIEAKLDYREN